MTRWLATLTVTALLTIWVGAEVNTPLAPPDQARLLQRNRKLVQSVIDNSLKLSAKPNPLDRAERCQRFAADLAEELQIALRDGDRARVAELGRHLDASYSRGVIPNLKAARQEIARGSQREGELFQVRDRAVRSLEPLESLLPVAGDAKRPELKRLSQTLQSSRLDLETVR